MGQNQGLDVANWVFREGKPEPLGKRIYADVPFEDIEKLELREWGLFYQLTTVGVKLLTPRPKDPPGGPDAGGTSDG